MAFVNISFTVSGEPVYNTAFVSGLPKPKESVPIVAVPSLGGGGRQASISLTGTLTNNWDGFTNGTKYFVNCAYAI